MVPRSWAVMQCSSLSLCLFCPGSEFRVGRGPWWYQENAERHAPCWEREGRQRQVQNPAPDPAGQHQAAYRWVWVHVSREEGWTQRWKETVSLIAMSTPHLPCKAQNLLPPQELLLFFYAGERAANRLCSFSLAKALPSSGWPITLLPAF